MPRPTHAAVVRHPESGAFIPLDPAVDYDPNDAVVKAYGWAFEPIENGHRIVESVEIEHATARPGEKSRARRTK